MLKQVQIVEIFPAFFKLLLRNWRVYLFCQYVKQISVSRILGVGSNVEVLVS